MFTQLDSSLRINIWLCCLSLSGSSWFNIRIINLLIVQFVDIKNCISWDAENGEEKKVSGFLEDSSGFLYISFRYFFDLFV